MYFHHVYPKLHIHMKSHLGVALFRAWMRELPFEGLELGTLLGRGGFGCVYRGTYRNLRCAVKVCELHSARAAPAQPGNFAMGEVLQGGALVPLQTQTVAV